MSFGSERSVLVRNPLKRVLVRLFGDTHLGRVIRFMYLQDTLDKLSIAPGMILDAGAGRGETSMYLAKRYPNAKVIGVEIDSQDLAYAMQIQMATGQKNLEFRQCNLEQLLPFGSFDLIILWEVLECIPDDTAALQNLYQALSPNGVLLVHAMHAEGAYRHIGARNLMDSTTMAWGNTGQVRAGYTEWQLEELLQKTGFYPISIRTTFGTWAMFAHSIFEVARTWWTPFYLAIFPALVFLGKIDINASKGDGGAVLAEAWKS